MFTVRLAALGTLMGAFGLIVGAVAVAVGDGGDPLAPPPPAQAKTPELPPVTYSTELGGTQPSVASDIAIQRVQQGLDPVVSKLVLGSPPVGAITNNDGLWLYATLTGVKGDENGQAIPLAWEADLAQGALADMLAGSAKRLDDVIAGSSIQLDTGDGSMPVQIDGGAGAVAAGQIFGSQVAGLADDQIEADVTGTLKRFGLEANTIKVLHPLGPAVYIVATVTDISMLESKFEALRAAIDGDPIRYEGVYIQINDPLGSPMVRASTSYRSGAGRVWFAHGQDSVLGIGHGLAASQMTD